MSHSAGTARKVARYLGGWCRDVALPVSELDDERVVVILQSGSALEGLLAKPLPAKRPWLCVHAAGAV